MQLIYKTDTSHKKLNLRLRFYGFQAHLMFSSLHVIMCLDAHEVFKITRSKHLLHLVQTNTHFLRQHYLFSLLNVYD